MIDKIKQLNEELKKVITLALGLDKELEEDGSLSLLASATGLNYALRDAMLSLSELKDKLSTCRTSKKADDAPVVVNKPAPRGEYI